MVLRFLFLVVLVCNLIACQTLPSKSFVYSGETIEARTQFLLQRNVWSFSGKLGLKYQVEGKNKLERANIAWQQNNARYQINFSGPLGLGDLELKGDEKGVELEEPQGLSIPWHALAYWLRALPYPEEEYSQQIHQAFQAPSNIIQLGWKIEYLDYLLVNGVAMPSKIKVKQGDKQLTLVLREWQID